MKKPWKIITTFKFYNLKKDGLKFLNKNNFKTSPWINDIVIKNNYFLDEKILPIKLFRIKVKELGFNKPTYLKNIYKKAKTKGLKLVNPEIALYTRLLYKEQKIGEWIRFATPLNSMIDSDGVPHLPKLGKALKTFFLETYWSYPKAVFHPKNEFIFQK